MPVSAHGVIGDDKVSAVLDRLYTEHEGQQQTIGDYFRARAGEPDFDRAGFDDAGHAFMADKLVALDRDKAEFCYQVCRALRAKQVVEAGTAFGVSTLFLAAAVRENLKEDGGKGKVYGAEYEPGKTLIARQNFVEAGLSEFIDLRDGDILQAFQDLPAPIDFLLIDIWVPMARPVLEAFSARLRPGAVIVCDNTAQFRESYRDFFEFIKDQENGLHSMTLPFDGGLELAVKSGHSR